VANGFPDMRSCLLHQKLQMLNVCMERRNIREGKLPFAMQVLAQEGKTDSDDEFFDCDDDRVVDDEEGTYNDCAICSFAIFFSHALLLAAEKANQSPYTPVGRISKLGKMLLIDSDEPLYIPVTQDPGECV
jgi:Rab3 GTPase-activating protein catalytic subunit